MTMSFLIEGDKGAVVTFLEQMVGAPEVARDKPNRLRDFFIITFHFLMKKLKREGIGMNFWVVLNFFINLTPFCSYLRLTKFF